VTVASHGASIGTPGLVGRQTPGSVSPKKGVGAGRGAADSSRGQLES
jgi:hypothetical protein